MAKKPKLTFEEKYDVIGVEPGIHHVAGFGRIDLTKLDVEEADHLYKAKFPFLQKKNSSSAPAEIEDPQA